MGFWKESFYRMRDFPLNPAKQFTEFSIGTRGGTIPLPRVWPADRWIRRPPVQGAYRKGDLQLAEEWALRCIWHPNINQSRNAAAQAVLTQRTVVSGP